MKKQYKIGIVLSIVLVLVGVYVWKNHTNKSQETSEIQWSSYNPEKEKGTPVLLELGTTTCPVCVKMSPILTSLDKKYKGKVTIKKINLERQENSNLAIKYDAMAVPIIVFIDKDGKDFYKKVGYMSEDEIVQVLDSMGVK